MNCYLPELMQHCPAGYSRKALRDAMQTQQILTARAVKCDENHDLLVTLGCAMGRIPRLETAEGIAEGRLREIAALRCVGQPVAVRVLEVPDTGEVRLSRRLAQRETMDRLLREGRSGDILPATVTNCTDFGAFCDIGCGVPALLPTKQLCVARFQHAGELLVPGQKIYAAIRKLDRVKRRIFLSQRELLGTWGENAALFAPGQTVTGTVRSIRSYGAFVALTPNLSGLVEADPALQVGDAVAVFIRDIQMQTLKIKLTLLHRLPPQPPMALQYFKTEGHLDQWRYGTEAFAKCYTIF